MRRKIGAEGVLPHPPEHLLQALIFFYMTKIFHLKVSMDLEFEAPKLVKVKAHKRLMNGKVVKVCSYYRRVEGRGVIDRQTI